MNISSCDVPLKSLGVPLPSPILLHILLFGYPILFLIGTVGNILSFIVLHPFGTRVSGHIYLACLAVFDTLSLFFFVLSFWSLMILRPYLLENGYEIGVRTIDHYLITAVACEIRTYLTFTTRMLSVWTVVIMSMERFLLIIAPLRFYKFLRPKVAWITMGVTCLLIGLINLPWMFSFTHVARPTCLTSGEPHSTHLSCVPNRIFRQCLLATFLMLTILPALLLFMTNIRIAETLTKRRHRWIAGEEQRSNASQENNRQDSLLKENHRVAQRDERMLTMRLFLVSVTFFILSTPSLIFVGIEAIAPDSSNSHAPNNAFADAYHISLFMFHINLTINFILYCLIGYTFRHAVLALVSCDWTNFRVLRTDLSRSTGSDS